MVIYTVCNLMIMHTAVPCLASMWQQQAVVVQRIGSEVGDILCYQCKLVLTTNLDR